MVPQDQKECSLCQAFGESHQGYNESIFADLQKEELSNTGKATTTEVSDFLLMVEEIGDIARQKFITECIDHTERFERQITRTGLHFNQKHRSSSLEDLTRKLLQPLS